MATRQTLRLKTREQREPEYYRDHDARPYVRERCGAVLKIAAGATPHAVARQGLLKLRDPDPVGRQQIMKFYTQLDRAYPEVDLIYVIQDNWNLHTHPDVLTALEGYPRIKPVWLPPYAPWLNPIEKLWRWLRQDVLKMHRWVEDWPRVKQRVQDFLEQFAHGSATLLRYVGLKGKGKLARVLNTS